MRPRGLSTADPTMKTTTSPRQSFALTATNEGIERAAGR